MKARFMSVSAFVPTMLTPSNLKFAVWGIWVSLTCQRTIMAKVSFATETIDRCLCKRICSRCPHWVHRTFAYLEHCDVTEQDLWSAFGGYFFLISGPLYSSSYRFHNHLTLYWQQPQINTYIGASCLAYQDNTLRAKRTLRTVCNLVMENGWLFHHNTNNMCNASD